MTDNIADYKELLIRIDERTAALAADMAEVKLRIEKNYVTKDEFEPIKRIVYAVSLLVITSFVGALFALIARQIP